MKKILLLLLLLCCLNIGCAGLHGHGSTQSNDFGYLSFNLQDIIGVPARTYINTNNTKDFRINGNLLGIFLNYDHLNNRLNYSF